MMVEYFISPSPVVAYLFQGPTVRMFRAPGGFYVCSSKADTYYLLLGSSAGSLDLPLNPTNFGRPCRPVPQKGDLSDLLNFSHFFHKHSGKDNGK